MQIRIINPVITTSWEGDTHREYADAARPGTQVSTVSLEWGIASIETRYDEALCIPGILNRAMEAEKEGVDAVIIDCMGDPGLFAAREALNIPVIGPMEASIYLAAVLGQRFSVISILDSDVLLTDELVTRYGLSARLASIRPIGISVLDINTETKFTLEAVIETSERVVREDGAHVIIPGCNLLAKMMPKVALVLAERGCAVPVLNPRSVAIKLAESLVDLGQTHSRQAFAHPGTKEIRWPVPAAFSR